MLIRRKTTVSAEITIISAFANLSAEQKGKQDIYFLFIYNLLYFSSGFTRNAAL